MTNRDSQHGRCVKDPSAWCDKCIAEAMQCIDNLPADYYEDNEPEMGDEEYIQCLRASKLRQATEWQEDQNHWQSSGCTWWSQQQW